MSIPYSNSPDETYLTGYFDKVTAKITDAHQGTDGTFLYDWVELSFDAQSGELVQSIPARTGSIGGVLVTPAVEMNNQLAAIGTVVQLRTRGIIGGKLWYEFLLGSGSDTSFLAILTRKCYYYGIPGSEGLPCECLEDTNCNGDTGPKRFIQYSWQQIADDGIDPGPPCGVQYAIEAGAACGCPKCSPAYHPRNLDLAVFPFVPNILCCGTEVTGMTSGNYTLPSVAALAVVRLQKGTGDYYLIEETHPWEDLWRRTGEFDDFGEKVFYRYWDQNDSSYKDGMEGRLIPAG